MPTKKPNTSAPHDGGCDGLNLCTQDQIWHSPAENVICFQSWGEHPSYLCEIIQLNEFYLQTHQQHQHERSGACRFGTRIFKTPRVPSSWTQTILVLIGPNLLFLKVQPAKTQQIKWDPGWYWVQPAPHVLVHCLSPILAASDVCQLAHLQSLKLYSHHNNSNNKRIKSKHKVTRCI